MIYFTPRTWLKNSNRSNIPNITHYGCRESLIGYCISGVTNCSIRSSFLWGVAGYIIVSTSWVEHPGLAVNSSTSYHTPRASSDSDKWGWSPFTWWTSGSTQAAHEFLVSQNQCDMIPQLKIHFKQSRRQKIPLVHVFNKHFPNILSHPGHSRPPVEWS